MSQADDLWSVVAGERLIEFCVGVHRIEEDERHFRQRGQPAQILDDAGFYVSGIYPNGFEIVSHAA